MIKDKDKEILKEKMSSSFLQDIQTINRIVPILKLSTS